MNDEWQNYISPEAKQQLDEALKDDRVKSEVTEIGQTLDNSEVNINKDMSGKEVAKDTEYRNDPQNLNSDYQQGIEKGQEIEPPETQKEVEIEGQEAKVEDKEKSLDNREADLDAREEDLDRDRDDDYDR